jgi:hypothetical protein
MVCGQEQHRGRLSDMAFEQQQREQYFVGRSLVLGLNEKIADAELLQKILASIAARGRDHRRYPVE